MNSTLDIIEISDKYDINELEVGNFYRIKGEKYVLMKVPTGYYCQICGKRLYDLLPINVTISNNPQLFCPNCRQGIFDKIYGDKK